MAMTATYDLESSEAALGRRPVAGIDEAGRGPWAGPVVAAAVILDPTAIPVGIADSKALDANAREHLYNRIRATAAIGVGIADVTRIDRDNILNATLWAMSEAVRFLPTAPRLALVDGNKAPRLACETRTIVSGDARCLSIAAASIVAKVTRDRIMVELGLGIPCLRLRAPQGLRNARAQGSPRTARPHRSPSPLLQAGAARPWPRASLRLERPACRRPAGHPRPIDRPQPLAFGCRDHLTGYRDQRSPAVPRCPAADRRPVMLLFNRRQLVLSAAAAGTVFGLAETTARSSRRPWPRTVATRR